MLNLTFAELDQWQAVRAFLLTATEKECLDEFKASVSEASEAKTPAAKRSSLVRAHAVREVLIEWMNEQLEGI